MSSRARSTVSHTASTTVSSVSAGELKSLKGFDIDEEFKEDTKKTFNGIETESSKLFLVSVPSGFPKDQLPLIPLKSGRHNNLKIRKLDNIKTPYVCDITDTNSCALKSLLVPANESQYMCKSIANYVHVRKSHGKSKVRKKFLPRPQPPQISEGLFERVKPFGWQGLESDKNDLVSDLVAENPRKRKVEQQTPEKKSKKNMDKSREKSMDFAAIDTSGQLKEKYFSPPPKKKKKRKHDSGMEEYSKNNDSSSFKKKKKSKKAKREYMEGKK